MIVEAPRGAAAEGVDAGGDDADRVEARVVPEASRSSIAVVASTSTGGMSSNVDDLAVELAEPGELDLVVAVPDDGLLREHDLLERSGVREARGRAG